MIMAGLALAVAVVLFIEFTHPLTEEQIDFLTAIDLSILAVFAVDYFYRLVRAQDKWAFFKGNIFDLIAIMPFDKAFRLARLVRLVRLARLARASRVTRMLRLFRLFRIFIFARRLWGTFKGVISTNGLIYVVFFEAGMESFGDALWWSLVTTTTVGYGDISPESTGGRILAGFLMIVGIGFLGMVTGSVATYFVDRLGKNENKAATITEEQIHFIKRKIDELDTLSLEDVKSLNRMILSVWLEKTQARKKIKEEKII